MASKKNEMVRLRLTVDNQMYKHFETIMHYLNELVDSSEANWLISDNENAYYQKVYQEFLSSFTDTYNLLSKELKRIYREVSDFTVDDLLDLSVKYSIKKFHQISTDEVYGTLGEEGYFTETSPIQPNSPYSASKASSDLIALAYCETYKMNVTVTNCSNNYGPYQHHEKLIPHMISKALKDEQLPVYGQGLNIRDWLFVEDHCEAIDIVLHQGRKGERYNIGGHNEKRNIEIVELILEELGKITGESVTEDVIYEIFSKFCLGK